MRLEKKGGGARVVLKMEVHQTYTNQVQMVEVAPSGVM